MQEAALDLVEQAQSNNGAYLNLRSVALQPPDLVINAGPSACLHGWLDLPPAPSDAGVMVSHASTCEGGVWLRQPVTLGVVLIQRMLCGFVIEAA